jgi:hypothetical protein
MNLPNGRSVSAEDVAENVWVRMLGRLAMIIAAAMLPLAGFTGKLILDDINGTAKETLEKVDKVADGVLANQRAILLMQGQVSVEAQRNTEQDRRLDEHGTRLTEIERRVTFGLHP